MCEHFMNIVLRKLEVMTTTFKMAMLLIYFFLNVNKVGEY